MKVLFLDIDGVLNSRRSCLALGGYPCPGRRTEMFDTVAVELVRNVCKHGVEIVLSSSWRNGKGDSYKNLLDLPIVDRTPIIEGIRGREIAKWLVKNGEPERWAILDDDSDMLDEQRAHFVHVDGRNGILLEDYERLCNILDVPT